MVNADPFEADFGRYLAKVEERDIDLLLLEEFHVNDTFVAWFCEKLGLQDVNLAGAWHSVPDVEGETDLLLRIASGNHRIGVLIENKINAPEQVEQDKRYHLRATRARDAGKFDEYVTVIIAPQRYLNALPSDSAYQHRISYEAIAEWFARLDGPRASWRHRIIREAIEQNRRGSEVIVSAFTTAFHHDFWAYLRDKHPRLRMNRPGNKGHFSNWIQMKGLGFPNDVKFTYKHDQQIMEIGFDKRTREDVLSAQSDLPDDVAIVQTGGTATLQIAVPYVDMKIGVGAQTERIEEVLQAAYRLLPYASLIN